MTWAINGDENQRSKSYIYRLYVEKVYTVYRVLHSAKLKSDSKFDMTEALEEMFVSLCIFCSFCS